MLREINGWRTRVMDFGEGDRVLVTHGGWTGSWELWEQQCEELARQGWRVIAYDHRGSGFARLENDQITLDALVDDVFALLDELGIERCVIAGESMGTTVVTLAALRHPERFDGLVLVAGAPKWRRVSLVPFLVNLTLWYPLALRAFITLAVPEKDVRDYVRPWGLSILRQARPRSARRLLKLLVGFDLKPRLGSIRVPTLVLHGTRDLIVLPRDGRALAAAIPGAESVAIPGAGHVPTMTRPASVSAAISRSFA